VSDGTLLYWIGVNLDIEDRKQTEFYLAEGQRLARTGSWAFNAAGFDYWSPGLFRIYGLDPGGKPPTVEEYMELIHPDDREFVAETIQKMFAEHRGFDFTKRIVRPDGEIRRIRCVGSPATYAEAVQEFIGTGIDVTEHELLTQELGRREAYLAEAQRLSHTGSFGWKPGTGELIWSAETYRIFEYDRAVAPTIDLVAQRVHPEGRADFQSVIERASRGASDFEHAYRLSLPDGRVKHVHALAHATQDAFGNREFVGAVTDITEQRRAEESLRESESYLAEAQTLSHTGSWAWNPNPNQDIRYWSEECYRVLGFDPAGPVPRFEEFFQNIHPDDQAASRERFENAIRDKADFEMDYRIVHPDKGVRDIHVVGSAVLDRSGDLHEFVGTVIDITERKAAEGKIREQEAELRQMLDLTPQQVAVFGPGGERLFANRVALDYVGLSLEEWLQTHGGFFRAGWFIHPDDRERAASAYSDVSRSGGSAYELELRVQGADGSYRWFLVRYNPLHDDKGQVKRWYVASTDIEDRKRAEEGIRKENIALREEIIKASMFEEIVGNSPPLQQVLSRVAKVAPTDSTVLITGETGTGKELIARAIHKASKRSDRAFVSVNCAAIPQSLIPSELFGHEKGAFTGAIGRRLGRFELAEGGTIFLDEVGELPPETQVALLRVLQEHEFERVGGNRSIKTNVRVIVATNRDLQACIVAGTFREDLFYRLNVFPIEIPSLRQRREDIRMLVQYFIDRYARELGKNIRTVSKETLDLFQSYTWPGNIRELRNVIERSVIVCETESFSVDESWLSRQPVPKSNQFELRERLNAQERETIEAALTESRGRVFGPTGAAAKLGIARSTLESKIKTLKIDKNRFKVSNPS
jgi:formate hydrogenlyase transcriptional activator